MNKRKKDSGAALILTMTIAIIVLVVMFGVVRVITALYIDARATYYMKLADEAGEAGTAYANACLDKNARVQTWGSAGAGDLTPDSDCRGSAGAYPDNKYVLQNGSVRTSFRVGDLDYSQDFTAQISAVGTTEVIDSSGTVFKSYSTVVKKAIVWPSDLEATKSVSGTYRTCAILSNDIWCWGRNRFGQLGNGKAVGVGADNPAGTSVYDSAVPVKVRKEAGILADKTIDSMFAAQFHSCALADGKVYCWGYNNAGQLGNGRSGTGVYSSVPVEVGGALRGKVVTAIGGSANTSCAIAEGKIYCWGENYRGTLGIGSRTGSSTPMLIRGGVMNGVASGLPTNYTATALSTSGSRSYNMCAIADRKAYCWGQTVAGQLGNGFIPASNPNDNEPETYSTVPVAVVGLDGLNVTSISQDGYFSGLNSVERGMYTHVCAVASGQAYCWGNSYYGQAGLSRSRWSTNYYVSTPRRVTLPAAIQNDSVVSIEVGLYHSCLLTSTNKVYCMGYNSTGQLGINDSSTNMSATLLPVTVGSQGIPSNETVVSIAAGANRGCAVTAQGRTYCWGLNDGGQIGDGTKINRFNPTESLFLRPTKNRYIY